MTARSILPRIAGMITLMIVCGRGSAFSADSFQSARDDLQRGKYAEAIRALTGLADTGDAAGKPAAIVALSQALLETGELEKAEERLAAAVDQFPDSAPLKARLAALQLSRGRPEEALKLADAALSRDGEQLEARLVRARLKVEQGKLPAATEDFRWFVQYYNRRPPKGAEALLAIADGSAEYARAKGVGQVFSFIVNDLTPDALKADPRAWRAYHISGSLLLEKYNNGQAKQEFERGLKINENAAELLVGLARLTLETREPEGARELAEKALRINRSQIDALLVLADLALGAENPAAAVPFVERALAVNPHHQRALARKAGCDLLLNGIPGSGLTVDVLENPEVATAVEKNREWLRIYLELLKRNPAPGQFLTDLGEVLEQARGMTQPSCVMRGRLWWRPRCRPRGQLWDCCRCARAT